MLCFIFTATKASFPKDTMLFSKDGKPILIQDLKVGDIISSIDLEGKYIEDKVTGFNKQQSTDKQIHIQVTYLQPGTKDTIKGVFMSPNHIALTGPKAIYSKKARELKPGDMIQVFDTRITPILSVDLVEKKGAYSPVTKSGRFMANGVVVSSYEDFPSHIIAHMAFSKWAQITKSMPWLTSLFNKKIRGKSVIQWLLNGFYKLVKMTHSQPHDPEPQDFKNIERVNKNEDL